MKTEQAQKGERGDGNEGRHKRGRERWVRQDRVVAWSVRVCAKNREHQSTRRKMKVALSRLVNDTKSANGTTPPPKQNG